jgi:hypothetical protein
MEELIEKLKQIFSQHFPGSIAELEPTVYGERLGGSLIWQGFEDVEQIDRQRQINLAIRGGLSPEERQKMTAILSFTPDEVALMREG